MIGSSDDFNPPTSIISAAAALGIAPGTLRRWLREGCPVVRPGRRGRGNEVLVDVIAVRQWSEASERDAVILEMAGVIPELLADAAWRSLSLVEGPIKRQAAGVLAGSWFVAASACLDYLRDQCSTVPEVVSHPDQVERLLKIARK